MPLSAARPGDSVQVRGGPLHFTFWPMHRTTRRYGLQVGLYTANPLGLIRDCIYSDCPATSRAEALAYLSQAEYLYRSATDSAEWAAKPLLLYYSFMNLAKAYVVTRSVRATLDRPRHGLTDRLHAGGVEIVDAYLESFASTGGDINVFADFLEALTGTGLPGNAVYDLPPLMAQLVTGHRLWGNATGNTDRFVNVQDILIMRSAQERKIWLVLQVYRSNLTRYGYTHTRLLNESGLSPAFREVASVTDPATSETLLQFEQAAPLAYTGRPSDKVPDLVRSLKQSLWAAVTSVPPHRQYYLYMVPPAERAMVLPQLCSVYAVTFYLGSVTRYRPQQFDRILAGAYGGQVQEFLSTQPTQFLYLLASEFARRDVMRPDIV